MRVVHFTRLPGPGHYSIEGTFASMREVLTAELPIEVATCPRTSQGVWPRVVNIWSAWRRRGEVNHILGDVHYLALGLPRRRTILTICDCGFAHHPSAWRRLLLRWFWLTMPARRSTRICAISEATRQEILALTNVPPSRVTVIPVGISSRFVTSLKPWPAGKPVVLQVGTTPNKNVVRLVEALRGLDCRLHLVGRMRPEIQEALERGGVEWRHEEGLDDDGILRAYREADLVAFASTYEGFGMPIVEAQATGRVVVTSRREPMEEVAGGAAVLVDPESVESIREGIRCALGDVALRERLIAEGIRNAARFGPGRIAEAYLRLYREVGAAGR